MNVAQSRTPVGCWWAIAGGWLLLEYVFPSTGVLAEQKHTLSLIVITLMFLGAIAATIERKRFFDSTLVTEAAPLPGQTFEGTIETPLTAEPARGIRVSIMLLRGRRRNRGALWESESGASSYIRNDRGTLTVPFRFDVPAELANVIDSDCRFTIRVRANILPIPYRASFTMTAT